MFNQGGKYHGNGSKEQHVGNWHSEHLEQELECTFEELAEGFFGHEDQQRC
jgi:hypothetical protein